MLGLSSYTFQDLSMSGFGAVLVLLGLVLFLVDLKVTNHGLPTIGGIGALILGGLTLFSPTSPYFWASLVTFSAVALLMGVILFVGVLREVPAARARPVVTGVEGMIGEVGVVTERVGGNSPGWVFVHGERWQAFAAVAPEDAHQDRDRTIGVGHRVQVVGFRDGKVVVLPLDAAALEHPPRS